MSTEQLYIFMHIPKTGGTTLNTIFRRQFQPHEYFDHESYLSKMIKLEQLTAEQKQRIKAVAGHYFYGVHHHFAKPFQYFTMLREPVDRVISSYYFLRDYPGYERVKQMTLEEFAVKEPEAKNLQTLMLSGKYTDPDLTAAKKNLNTFSVVGVTEQFDDTLFLLQQKYGWTNVEYTRKNITKKRKAKEEIPANVLELIKQQNALDIKLYEYSKQLLNQRLQKLSEQEKRQLQAFKLNLQSGR